jgi:hypothetical protein
LALVEDTVRRGFVLAPDVVAEGGDLERLVDQIDGLYGVEGTKLNQAFHKSWDKVKDAPIAELVMEQTVHYITTYGFEAAGVFDGSSVYVPGEVLQAPELKDGLRVVVIRGLTKNELRAELQALLGSGIALSEDTLADVLDVATFVGFTEDDVAVVRNREATAALYTYLGLIPASPVEFLRFAIYKATSQTLLIKSNELVEQIKGSRSLDVVRAFELYDKQYGVARLGEIFYRFKPLFLAFRTSPQMRQIVNEIRRAARTHHKPLPADPLNDVTASLARGESPDLSTLDDANTFRKIRLAYALKYRAGEQDAILYRIRNGRTWATEFSFTERAAAKDAYDRVVASVVNDVARSVSGRTVHIPKGIHYGLPATEKQFTAAFPSGTYVKALEHMVCGIHWMNVEDHRIDLDLSMLSTGDKFGWDSSYRSSDRELLFSGDMTDAPQPLGASEFYYLGGGLIGAYLLMCNFFNYRSTVKVPAQIIVASQKSSVSHKSEASQTSAGRSGFWRRTRRPPVAGVQMADGPSFVADPNRILAASHLTVDVKQKVLGIAVATREHRRFYFAEFNQGSINTSRPGGHAELARKYLLSYYLDAIDLNSVLIEAGATMVDDPANADLDLRPEAVDKGTFIRLLTPSGGAIIEPE